jgi:hypothetical protein
LHIGGGVGVGLDASWNDDLAGSVDGPNALGWQDSGHGDGGNLLAFQSDVPVTDSGWRNHCSAFDYCINHRFVPSGFVPLWRVNVWQTF